MRLLFQTFSKLAMSQRLNGSAQQTLRNTGGVVWIGVDKLQRSRSIDQEHARYRQRMVLGTAGLFEIDAKALVLLDRGVIDTESDAIGLHQLGAGIRGQDVVELVLVERLAQFFRPIRTDRDQLDLVLGEQRLEFAQLAQLQIAVRAPAAAIEHQQGGLAGAQHGDPRRFAVQGLQVSIRCFDTGRWQTNVFGIGEQAGMCRRQHKQEHHQGERAKDSDHDRFLWVEFNGTGAARTSFQRNGSVRPCNRAGAATAI